VLEDACRAIGADSQIDEAHRDLTVDSDTQGAPGHPPIVETILRKIDAARVFVADMTFVAARPAGGRSPNPNVLIEYGWALKTHTHERIILVMNTAYGEASGEALPFDLRASRWPMQYHLPEDATPETKVEVKRRLTKELTAAIRACLQTLADAPAPPRRVPFTDLRAWALEAGWNGDVQAATVGDNDWWSFTKRLRQAAADGTIAFTGRRYLYDFGKDTDSEPLIAVPRAHFDEFGFDIIQLAQADNYDIFTGKPGESPPRRRETSFATCKWTRSRRGRGLEAPASPRHRRIWQCARKRAARRLVITNRCVLSSSGISATRTSSAVSSK
jgi:hypothetical protein